MIEKLLKHVENKNEKFIIFDIGSRDCVQSIEFYNAFPNSKIYAFECNPNTLDICKKNIEPYNDRITLIEGAVCDYDGNITFYPINQKKTISTWKDGNPGASSIFKSNGEYSVETYIQDETITPCHRLDSVMNKYGIPKVDIIWMDLQGAELLALIGLGDHLQNVKYIHTKACHSPIYTNQALFPEINNYLVNYYCFNLLTNINTKSQFEDVIYENKFYKNPIFNTIDLTHHEQLFIRGKPKEYILHTINLFKKYTDAKVILEIGSIRQIMCHDINEFNPNCCNDGHSTYFWKEYTNANIYTVDIDKKSKNLIESDPRLVNVKSFTDDAINFSKTFDKKIDLLFLDAWDVMIDSPYAEKHLEIFNILKDNLSQDCLILIDDTDICSGGKGKLLIPYLLENGFKCIFNKRQTLFIRSHHYKKNIDLSKYERKIFSQNGEDGITIEIINRLNIKNGYYVELRTQNAKECNTRILKEQYNWQGLLMNGFQENADINLKKEFITRENIVNLFDKYSVPKRFNLLSIRIDFNDFYVLHKILQKYEMDIIILEYNAYFLPDEDNIVIYEEMGNWDGTNYFGASLLSYTKLLNKFGYSLIYTEKGGVNAFFVKNENNTKFEFHNEINFLYNTAKYGSGPRGGHTKDNKLREYVKFNDIVDSFDIVICVGPNDADILYKQIEFTKKNIIGYRNIYLICYDPNINIDGCITINENIFPFSLETVSSIHGKLNRNGWYLQQLLKLYALMIIPEILDKCLVIDADTFFLKPTVFIKNNKCLYNFGSEYNRPYFAHMLKLDETLIKVDKNKSGICHHMMFEKKYINELINKIEENHNDKFYNIFLKMVTDFNGSGASEYEIYFNYILKNHSNNVEIRNLKWYNSNTLNINADVDYISYHWYMRS